MTEEGPVLKLALGSRPRRLEQVLGQKRGLQRGEVAQAFLREDEQALQLLVREGGFLAAALHLDELAAAGHDDVEIDTGVPVLDVGEVEQFTAVENAGADGGDRVGERVLGDFFRVEELLDRKTGDSRGDSGVMKLDVPKAGGMVPLALKVPIGEMAAGSYILEVQATDSSGNTIKRTTDFEIE